MSTNANTCGTGDHNFFKTNPNGQYVEIHLQGNVDTTTIEVVHSALEIAISKRQEILPVFINSYGGQVSQALAVSDLFASSPSWMKIVTVCVGKAMSAGAYILSAGHIRYAYPSSIIMVHDISSRIQGKYAEIEAEIGFINLLRDNFWKNFEKFTGNTYEWRKHLASDSSDRYYTPEDAYCMGIIDEIGVPEFCTSSSLYMKVRNSSRTETND